MGRRAGSAGVWGGVLRVGPGRREAPLGARGPERIFCTTDAVAVVSFTAVLEQVTAEPTNDCGSKGQDNRSKITPSWTPSSISYASGMAFTKYSFA